MLSIHPIDFATARLYVELYHRHNVPPTGHKFSICVKDDAGALHGVAMVGRPIARALDDGLTLEVNRTCTDGTANANSKLYGAAWAAAKALGYRKMITYTQADESGASLRAVGAIRAAELPPRNGWENNRGRESTGNGYVARVRWEWARA